MKDEALQFANELDELQRAEYPNHYEAADELRRLHSVNAELLEALQELLASERANSFEIVGRDTDGHPLNAAGVARVKARLAIAKAQEKGQP
jgi:hypothetical protein